MYNYYYYYFYHYLNPVSQITVWKDEGKDGRVDKHILIGLIKSLALNFKPKELVRASEVNISNMRTSQINGMKSFTSTLFF